MIQSGPYVAAALVAAGHLSGADQLGLVEDMSQDISVTSERKKSLRLFELVDSEDLGGRMEMQK
jgi:hypothetical protein